MNNIFQRIISIFLYTFPLKASLPFGYYLFIQYPALKIINYIALPFALIEDSIPFGSILIFFIIFLGLARNPKVTYFIRYNACQAVLLNIALILLGYIVQISQLSELSSLLFVISILVFIYVTIKCVLGLEPEITLISKSARIQIY